MHIERTMRNWIQTWSGKQFWPTAPRAEDVDIEDIAWMLAQQNRWKGATIVPYNIAQHSVYVSSISDSEYMLQGLLHDATEAYLGDMAGPIKSSFPDFVKAENALWEVIANKYGVPVELHPSVKRADLVLLNMESLALMRKPPVEWRQSLPPPADFVIKVAGPSASAELFLERFKELTR